MGFRHSPGPSCQWWLSGGVFNAMYHISLTMGVCFAKLFPGKDADDVFSYQTAKIVRIHDRRLGLLHYFFQFAIFMYIVVYVVIIEQGYEFKETPVGSMRISTLGPDAKNPCAHDFTPQSELAYCSEYTGGSPEEQQLPCVNWGANRVVYPESSETGVVLTSRVNISSQYCTQPPHCDEGGYKDNTTRAVFTTNMNSFSLYVDHSAFAPINEYTYSTRLGGHMSGEMLRLDPSTNKFVEDASLPHWKEEEPNYICMSDFFKAAGFNFSNPNEEGETHRYSGAVLLVEIEYSNLGKYNCGFGSKACAAHYKYSVRAIKNVEFKISQVIWTSYPQERMLLARHGIRLVFEQTGQLGRFAFQSLLIELVSSVALIATATIVVDMLALKFMPQKDQYNDYKFQDSVDFSDLRDGLIDPNMQLDSSDDTHTIAVGLKQATESDPLLKPIMSKE